VPYHDLHSTVKRGTRSEAQAVKTSERQANLETPPKAGRILAATRRSFSGKPFLYPLSACPHWARRALSRFAPPPYGIPPVVPFRCVHELLSMPKAADGLFTPAEQQNH
jgi:hypothetical protein